MLFSALLESQLEVLAQQCAINIPHIVAYRVNLRSLLLHESKITQCGASRNDGFLAVERQW